MGKSSVQTSTTLKERSEVIRSDAGRLENCRQRARVNAGVRRYDHLREGAIATQDHVAALLPFQVETRAFKGPSRLAA